MLALAAAQLAAQSGDAAKGKALVESSRCLTCHRIEDKGSRTGPNLSDIGDRRKVDQIKRAIVTPDDEVLPENRFVSVTLKDGSTVQGRLLNHDAISVQMIDSKEQLRSFQNSAIRGYTILLKGLMPTFQGKLSDQELADMVAYLSSLKGTDQP